MKKWKKFIAMGLAVSMIVPSCIPQTLWASEFSAGSVESAADVFEDGADMRQEVSQEIKYLMRITVEMSLEQES